MDFDAFSPIGVSGQDIVEYIERKRPHEIGAWNELGSEEYARSFAVAGTAGYNVVGDIYDAFLETIRNGGDERDFAELIEPVLLRKGWAPGPGQSMGNRLQLIFDTNLRVARAVGRWGRIHSVAGVMPYLQGSTVGDGRVRDAHTHFQGIVLPVAHWFWQEFFPPLFFRCRCDVVQLTRSQFARRGLAITDESDVFARAALIRPQSWGVNVALAGTRILEEQMVQAQERVPGLPALPYEAAQDRGSSVWGGIIAQVAAQLVEGLARAFLPG